MTNKKPNYYSIFYINKLKEQDIFNLTPLKNIYSLVQ